LRNLELRKLEIVYNQDRKGLDLTGGPQLHVTNNKNANKISGWRRPPELLRTGCALVSKISRRWRRQWQQ